MKIRLAPLTRRPFSRARTAGDLSPNTDWGRGEHTPRLTSNTRRIARRFHGPNTSPPISVGGEVAAERRFAVRTAGEGELNESPVSKSTHSAKPQPAP